MRGEIRRPLHGVPIAVKDLCWTQGVPTAAGMTIYKDFRPTEDATVVRKLYAAGAIILGKLQLTEGAWAEHHLRIPAPVNPWNAAHWSGASSSGSGVTTAAGPTATTTPARRVSRADAGGYVRRNDQMQFRRGSAVAHWAPSDAPLIPSMVQAPAPVASRLLLLHEAAGHLAKTASDILAKPEVARAIEEALVEAMILCLTEGHSGDVRNVHRHRATVMGRLEEVLASTPDRPLYMPQLCATVGSSYTTLRDCCQQYLGMSPKRYLWLRRMHLVRRDLRRADAETTTVTEIATDYGFWELGRFAGAYRSLFGEPPSAALCRPPGRLKTGRNHRTGMEIC